MSHITTNVEFTQGGVVVAKDITKAASPYVTSAHHWYEHEAIITIYDEASQVLGAIELTMTFAFTPGRRAGGYGKWHNPGEQLAQHLHSATWRAIGGMAKMRIDAWSWAQMWLAQNGKTIADAIEARAADIEDWAA